MTLPEAPIESATVFFHGDESVGIKSASFDLEVFIDLNCISEEEKINHLRQIRNKIIDLYEIILGESASVLFDFEIKAMNKSRVYQSE